MPNAYPYRDTDDKAIEKGEGVSGARYYHDLNAKAKEIVDRLDVEVDEDGDQMVDMDDISSEIDSVVEEKCSPLKRMAQRGEKPVEAYAILFESNNEDAYMEDYGGEFSTLVDVKRVDEAVVMAARFAYHEDLGERVFARLQESQIETNPSGKYPYRDSDEKALEKGIKVSKDRYFADLKARAEEIVENLNVENDDGDLSVDQDDVQTALHEYADTAVTYTRDAYGIMFHTESQNAYADSFGMSMMSDSTDNVNDMIVKAAYMAFETDLSERVDELLDSKGIELNPSKRSGPKRPKRRRRNGG